MGGVFTRQGAITEARRLPLGTLILLGVIGGAALAAGILGYRSYRGARTEPLAEAEGDLRRGHFFHALQKVDRNREFFVASERGCRIALEAATGARAWDSLGWMLEDCEDVLIEGPELHLARARFWEARGDWEVALNLLEKQAQTHPGTSAYYQQMARLNARHGRFQEAGGAWTAAVAQAPRDVALLTEALVFFYHQRDWPQAGAVARRLKPLSGLDTLEILLTTASALERSGDSMGALDFKRRAEALFGAGRSQDFKRRYGSLFPELFAERGGR